jgi:Fe-S cluster assembly protein SufD
LCAFAKSAGNCPTARRRRSGNLGQIDEDELFYLRTRGIPTKVAQRLLVTGFLDEVIRRLDHPAIAEHLHRLIEEKFAK